MAPSCGHQTLILRWVKPEEHLCAAVQPSVLGVYTRAAPSEQAAMVLPSAFRAHFL